MLDKQSLLNPRDVAADKDSDALDFGPALSTQPGTNVQKDNSITLWGPGVNVQERTPSSILTESLHVWRKDNAQLPAAKAAEELHNMYENLPPEALELTFQDMIGRKNSLEGKSNDKAGNNNKSPPRSNAVDGGVVKKSEQVKDALKEKESGPKFSLFAKIAAMFSSKEVYASSQRTTLTKQDLDKLLDKRRRQSASSNREGMYSASTTPVTSFRRLSPITSPKLSPTPSFHKLMLQVDRNPFRSKHSNSVTFLQTYLDEGGLPPVHEGSHSQIELPQNPKRTTRGKDANDCSVCSTSNLFFLKTTCQVCGKAFCPSCKNLETKEVGGGRRCKDNCGERLTLEDRFVAEKEKGRRSALWTISLGSCIRMPLKSLD